ncbi:MAG: terminase gpA endonuclease subunit [Opitutaceae bacterium]|jgi:hypothetical protein
MPQSELQLDIRVLPDQSPQPQSRGLLSWFIDEVLFPSFRPLRAVESVWRWADKSVFLDSKSRSSASNYRSELTPWTREFQETFTDPNWDEDHVIKSSRSGFTEACLNILRFMPEHSPGQALYAIDSAEEVKKISRDRLIPTLKSAARDAVTDDPDDMASKIIRLTSMVIHLAGSYSAGIFRNKWLRCCILDEVEVNSSIDGEGTLHDLARSRQEDVDDAKLFTLSKAGKWGSVHHRECVSGTLSCYLAICPQCGTYQELSFDGASPTHQLRIETPLRDGESAPSPKLSNSPSRLGRLRYDHCKDLTGEWDMERIESETYSECVSGCQIRESEIDKRAMMNSDRWLKTNPRHVPRKRSRHISDLYSLHPKLTWGKLARMWVQAQGDPVKEMHFINNHMGLPYREKAADVSEEHVLECRSPYQPGTTPFVPDLLVVGGDSQDAFWKYVVLAVKLSGECAVCSWGIATTPAELIEVLDTPILLSSDPSKSFIPQLGFIDAGGHRTEEVYDLFAASGRRLLPCFGRREATLKQLVWKGKSVMHRMRPLDIYFVSDSLLKRRIYLGQINRIREIKAAVVAHAQGRGPSLEALGLPQRLHIPGGGPFDAMLRAIISELCGERLGADGIWKNVEGHRNDFGDAVKYAIACFEYVRPVIEDEKAEEKAREDAEKAKGILTPAQ